MKRIMKLKVWALKSGNSAESQVNHNLMDKRCIYSLNEKGSRFVKRNKSLVLSKGKACEII